MSAIIQNINELLKQLDSATLQYLDELLAEDASAVCKIIQNVLSLLCCVSEETEKRLDKPLVPKPFEPSAPHPDKER